MSTKKGFTTASFREQAAKNMSMSFDNPTIPAQLGLSAALLQNAADYIDKANEVLALAFNDVDDNAIARKIKELLE